MKCRFLAIILGIVLVGCGVSGAAFASGTVVAGRASLPIVPDGSLSDPAWSQVEPLLIDEVFASALIASGTFVVDGAPVSGPDDASLRMYFVWDDTYLYIGLDVTDDQIVTDRLVGELSQQDSVEIIVDPDGTGQQRIPLFFAPQTKTGSGPWFSLPGAQLAVAWRKGGVVGKMQTLGYSAEIAIPRQVFAWTYHTDLKPRAVFGLEVRLNDVDLVESKSRAGETELTRERTLLTWTGTKPVLDWQESPEYGKLLIGE